MKTRSVNLLFAGVIGMATVISALDVRAAAAEAYPEGLGVVDDSGIRPSYTDISFTVFATSMQVFAELWTGSETGAGDIVIYAWLENVWTEVGRVPGDANRGSGIALGSRLVTADSLYHYIPLSGLRAGHSYIFKVVDENGTSHVLSETVLSRTAKILAVCMNTETVTITFETEPSRLYLVMMSSDLVTWTPEAVKYPTATGLSDPVNTPFNAGPGTQTQIQIPVNGRKTAFFKTERVDW